MLKMPAVTCRAEHIASAQVLLSGRGEWGHTGNSGEEEKQKQGRLKPVLQAKPQGPDPSTAGSIPSQQR